MIHVEARNYVRLQWLLWLGGSEIAPFMMSEFSAQNNRLTQDISVHPFHLILPRYIFNHQVYYFEHWTLSAHNSPLLVATAGQLVPAVQDSAGPGQGGGEERPHPGAPVPSLPAVCWPDVGHRALLVRVPARDAAAISPELHDLHLPRQSRLEQRLGFPSVQ